METAMMVLVAVGASSRPQSLKAISAASGMSASKAHRYLASLLRSDFVRQDPETRNYELGAAALQNGLSALMQLDIARLTVQAVVPLSERTGLTSLASVWGNQGPTIIRLQRGARHVVTSLGLGSVLPALGSATGRVFLAFSNRATTSKVVSAELRRLRHAGADVPKPQQIERDLASVRAAGLAWVDGLYIPGLRAISAPVRDAYGDAVLAITLISAEEPIADPSHPAAQVLRETCNQLSMCAGLRRTEGPLSP